MSSPSLSLVPVNISQQPTQVQLENKPLTWSTTRAKSSGNTAAEAAAAAAPAASSIKSQWSFYSLQTHGVSSTRAKLEQDGAGDKVNAPALKKKKEICSALHPKRFSLPSARWLCWVPLYNVSLQQLRILFWHPTTQKLIKSCFTSA